MFSHAEKFYEFNLSTDLINIYIMNKLLIAIIATLLVTAVLSDRVPPCPVQSNIGSLISARVTIAPQQSLVTLVQGVDTQCYNQPLPYDFASVPEVAIAVHDFESRLSNDLFFSIKNIKTDSLTFIPFLIRTQWRYTSWSRIAFSFIAEDRRDFESGYYQIDSGALGGCEPGKNIEVLLPFRNIQITDAMKYKIFLSGFEISSQRFNADAQSPFEVQLSDSRISENGIIVLVTVTTVTQVHSLHISYIAWISTSLSVISGSYVYDATVDTTGILAYTPLDNIGRNYARLFGLAGFIINFNSQNINLSTTWTGASFQFSLGLSQKLVQYFSFQYLFFIGSECASCPGYPFSNNGVCIQTCPLGSFPTNEKTCIYCGDGNYWDGSSCIKLCPVGQNLNVANNQCECPLGLNWNGTVCISCTLGRVFNDRTKLCECPSNSRWNGFSCAAVQQCTYGRQWNVFSFRCECPAGSRWNGTFCVRNKICTGGSFLDQNTNNCVCPDGTYLNNGVCQSTGCIGGQLWDGKVCSCPAGLNWNGSFCLLCINGQIWNQNSKACECEVNNVWNGNFCEKQLTCSGGRVWNKEFQVCMCPDGRVWGGNTCIVKEPCCCGKFWNEITLQCDCPDNFNWDGKTCVFCTNGKIWDPSTLTCICQNGSQWNGQFCAVTQRCYGGSVWNQNTWSCICPITTVWDGVKCVVNPCNGGQIWDNFSKVCVCPTPKVLSNGVCVKPELACISGQVWDPVLLICVCKTDTWFNGITCVPVPKCVGNQLNNAFTNKCECPPLLVFLASKQLCGDPTCPPNKRWDGQNCVELSCPPNSFYNGSACVCPFPSERCLPWELYDGIKCVYYQSTCPKGTKWNGTACVSNTPDCPDGYFKYDNQCRPFSRQCLPETTWSGNRCVPEKGCPYGTVGRADSCMPYNTCQGGQVWDSSRIQCVCPQGTGWSGKECIVCAGGQVWTIDEGCTCPEGKFMNGAQCETPSVDRCKLIPNAYFNPNRNLCLCNPGFSVIGYQCVCRGVAYENFCDRCAHRPNSQYFAGICKCNDGYTLYGTECLPSISNGNNVASDCNAGSVFDTQQKKCLACPAGCLTCKDCYTCLTCKPEFTFDPAYSLCRENCGDGKRFISECDDGNNLNGDGCSSDCKIEPGHSCIGGSPDSADTCDNIPPQAVSYIVTGQVRFTTKVVVNLQLNFFPNDLILSRDCYDSCSSALVASVTSGPQPTSIRAIYIAGSRYSFSVEFEFSKPWIAAFTAVIKVNPTLSRYFQNVDITPTQIVNVVPAQLQLARKSTETKLT